VQKVLLANPRKAKEVAAVRAITELKPHECIGALAESKEPSGAYHAIELHARVLLDKLRITIAEGEPVWRGFVALRMDNVALYDAVKVLGDDELDALHVLLAALSFGQNNCERLDTGESLFNRVAQDLAIDMRSHWRPDEAFLKRRTREQLVSIASECGYAEGRSGLPGYKKSELVTGLLRHFADALAAAKPSAAQKKAITWLPEAMSFPAVDPDAGSASDNRLDG
jgi:ParB family chromosome partitioning protein